MLIAKERAVWKSLTNILTYVRKININTGLDSGFRQEASPMAWCNGVCVTDTTDAFPAYAWSQ